MITAFKRTIKAGWYNFTREGSLLFANLFIMTMVISLVGSLILFKETSRFLVSDLQRKVDIAVYFKSDSTEDQIISAKEKITKLPEVKNVQYVSQQQALDSFIEKHKDNPVLTQSVDAIGANPFLAAINIQASQVSQYQAIANFLEQSDFKDSIEKIDFIQRKPVIDRIFSLTSNLNRIGIAFSIVLAIIAILVAFNSVKLAIYNSREEIKIQRLVGASNWFIRGPFVMQGAIVGAFAALISFFIFCLFSWILSPKIVILFPSLNFFRLFLANIWILVLVQFVSGIGLGIISSIFAVRKYLEA